ncbi:MAG: hypothetical protein PVI43_06530 [Candidatus Bathyarchaeota archaeon]|jgi:hypothetical protein
MKKLLLIPLILLMLAGSAFGAWTFNSACTVLNGSEVYASGELFYMQCDLNSDGSAETDIDVWDNFKSNATGEFTKKLGNGGTLYAVEYKQGTTAPDNDFLLTIYNGGGYPIFSETIDYDEAGQGITGGYYPGGLTEGHTPAVQGGLTIDVADIGGSGDDIILTFIFLISR